MKSGVYLRSVVPGMERLDSLLTPINGIRRRNEMVRM